jgi:hypothetical protein
LKSLAAGGGSLLLALACVEPEPGSGIVVHDRPEERVAEQTIDAGAAVDLDPGAGVGVAVAYLGAGRWELSLSCDTAVSDEFCNFDVIASVDESSDPLGEIEGLELEAEDELEATDPLALQLRFVTGEDLDGAAFTTSPGATVRVSALLFNPVPYSMFDWTDDPRLLSWVGHGALNRGAPSNPIDLIPDQP